MKVENDQNKILAQVFDAWYMKMNYTWEISQLQF